MHIPILIGFAVAWLLVNVWLHYRQPIFGWLKRVAQWGYWVAGKLVTCFSRIDLEPLPKWTNLPLFFIGCLIWAFAISLNWLGDNRAYVISSLVTLAILGLLVFVRVGRDNLIFTD